MKNKQTKNKVKKKYTCENKLEQRHIKQKN